LQRPLFWSLDEADQEKCGKGSREMGKDSADTRKVSESCR